MFHFLRILFMFGSLISVVVVMVALYFGLMVGTAGVVWIGHGCLGVFQALTDGLASH